MNLTVAYITSRPENAILWFLDSLNRQAGLDFCRVLVVDALHPRPGVPLVQAYGRLLVSHVAPKPCVWQGPHRLTQHDWWAASCARNTALCLCVTEWIAFVDDRSVLMPGWIAAVHSAMFDRYVVCGPYEKRRAMTVENGVIRNAGIVTGEDHRLQYVRQHWSDPRHKLTNPYKCPGAWTYGCSIALPLEWALAVNGFDETCDSLSGEDYIFGTMLENAGYPVRFDTRMMMVEDRTPENLGPAMIRKDKGTSPNDKSHALLNMLKDKKRATHPLDLVEIRQRLAEGKPWPIPRVPDRDWYDGEPLATMQP